MTLGNIHSYETFGSVDGPGVRFVLFMQGCRLRCRYCHNPDTWDTEKAAQRMTPEEVLRLALRYRDYWGDKGGITVSGGEPLLQVGFLTELFTLAKEKNIHTALDTAAGPFTQVEPFFSRFRSLMDVTDLVLLDIKHIRSQDHKHLTGVDNANILEAARFLDRIEKPMWIRHVLVPGWTDDESALRELADFIQTLKHVERVEVLPYHDMAIHKWDKLGIKYVLRQTPVPTRESVEKAKKILCAA